MVVRAGAYEQYDKMANKEEELPHDPVPDKLKLFRSPIKEEETGDPALAVGFHQTLNPASIQHLGFRSDLKDEPILMRNADATNLEVFYDLFLAVSSRQATVMSISPFPVAFY